MPRSPRPLLARQVALALGAVGLLATAMCALMLVIISDVSGLVAGMRHDEAAIRQGLELATAVRELALETQGMTVDGERHRSRYEDRRNQVRARIQELSPRIPEREHWRLEALGQKTQRMHDTLMAGATRAVNTGDVDELGRVRLELETLSGEAFIHADALAQIAASQMAHAHVLATDATRTGLVGGGVFVLLILGLSLWFSIRLRVAVLKPLSQLTQAARAFGGGNFEHRVGPVGQGEIAELGEAFDHMADELARREARVVHHERMAAIGQLAAGIAHEMNNPIGIIRGYLKTMRPDGDPALLAEELQILDEEAAQCQRIAEDLLAYARSDDLSTETIEIQSFLKETATRFGESTVGQGYAIAVEAASARLVGDRSRLRQVLLNLLANAAQVSTPQQEIVVRGRVDGGYYELCVEDRGPGIAQEDRRRVFEPFFTKRAGGTGLGLAVCKGIVEAHRGTIEVVDTRGQQGATFCLRLPLESRE